MTRRRQSGFTLVEILIALSLAAITSAFLLMITRSQILTYGANDQLARAQLNARAGTEYVESILRRACGGIAYGEVGVNVAGVTPAVVNCVRVWDGVEGPADYSNGTFSSNNASAGTKSDAIEVIYGTSPVTGFNPAAATPAFSASVPAFASVCDVTGFNVGDLVLVTDGYQALLYKIASIAVSGTDTNCPSSTNVGKLNFDFGGTAAIPAGQAAGTNTPAVTSEAAFSGTTGNGLLVMKATSLALYRYNSAGDPKNGTLVVDPDGVAGANHNDAQPAVEGVVNFELAIGSDSNNDGILSDMREGGPTPDEWLGNATGELTAPSTAFYFNVPSTTSGVAPLGPQYLQLRTTLVVRTENTFQGDGTVGSLSYSPVEDRTNNFATSASSTTGAPRYRIMRMEVAPRVWNLLN